MVFAKSRSVISAHKRCVMPVPSFRGALVMVAVFMGFSCGMEHRDREPPLPTKIIK